MFKKVLIIWIFVFSFSISFWVFAISDTQKWAILDSFKKKQYDLLFESNLWEVSKEEKEIFNISKRINLFSNIKDNITNERQSYETKSIQNLEKIVSLEQQVKQLDEDIENSTNNIEKLNSKIIETNTEIESIKNVVKVLTKKVSDNKEILLKYLVYIYKKSNTIYSEEEVDNLKSIILNWEDISELLNDIYFKWIIEVAWKNLIEKHKEYISKLYFQKIDLEKKEDSLKSMRKAVIVGRKTLKDKKEFKDELLKITKNRQWLYEKYIKDKIEVEKAMKFKAFKEKIKFDNVKDNLLKKYNCNYVDISKNSFDLKWLSEICLNINKLIYAESKLKSFTNDWTNIFSWPVKPIYWLSAYFKDKEYKKLLWAEHDAIDIIIEQWTSIQAPEDWYVIFIEPPDSPDYSYMAIKHYDWYVTVYWHLSEILVKEYDFVKKWELIAKTWWEYWTNWAWYITTWPHLHFEVFKDKQSVDPLNYLSLYDIPYKYISDNYKFKYSLDFKEEKLYDFKYKTENSKTFKLDWDTETERQQSLIDKYAVWSFRDWQMWVDESLDWNIDPSFVMCIWLAETSLWKNLKTSYNIWNIWNTDSWATRTLTSARSWVYSIVSTLNNKYLWKYTEIRELSRYWNKNWSIYASSPDNWHNNIIKCMSHIKWRYIPDDYNFRIIN